MERAARTRRGDRRGARDHTPRRPRATTRCAPRPPGASRWCCRTAAGRPAVRRHHRRVLDQPVLVRGARGREPADRVTTSRPPRPRATRSCSPASAATRPSPRAGPTTRTASPPPTRRPRRSSSSSGSAATRASASAMLVEIMAGVLADSCYGTVENTRVRASPAGTASRRAPASSCSTSTRFLPATSSERRVDAAHRRRPRVGAGARHRAHLRTRRARSRAPRAAAPRRDPARRRGLVDELDGRREARLSTTADRRLTSYPGEAMYRRDDGPERRNR